MVRTRFDMTFHHGMPPWRAVPFRTREPMTISTRPSMIRSVEEFKQNVQPGTGRKTFSVLLVRASAKPIFRAEPDLPEDSGVGIFRRVDQ